MGTLGLEGTPPLPAQSEQIEIEAETRLRRVDIVSQKQSHGPTITGGEQFDSCPNTDETVVDYVIHRICIQKNVIRNMIKHGGNYVADNAVGIGRAGATRVGGIPCTVLRRIQVDIGVRGQKPVRPVYQIAIPDAEIVRSGKIQIQ